MRRLSCALATALCVAVLSSYQGAARADDAADALLAKHRAFAGWQLGDGTFNTMRITGALTDQHGKTLDTYTQVRQGLLYRSTYVDLEHGGVREDHGFTGNIFWSSNENGFTTPTIGDSARAAFALDALFGEGTTHLSGTSRGSATLDGKTVQIVRVTLPKGFSIDLSIDPASGAYVQAVIDPGGTISETIHILRYAQAAPGKQVIAAYRIGDDSSVWSYSKFEPNVVLAVSDLHPPAPRAIWSFTNPQPFPFIATDTRFIVDAKVNGVAGRFILDTGSDSIVLSRDFAARAHVKQVGSAEAAGVAGTTKTDVDRLDSFEIGGNTLSNVVAFAQSGQMDEKAPDGLIGFDLFGGAVVKLDVGAQRMTIEDPSTVSLGSDGVLLNVDLSDGVPIIPMKVDGTIDVNATLDTGSYYYVLFGTDLIAKYGLRMLVDNTDAGYLQAHPEISGVGGVEADRCGHIDSLVLGPIVYQNPPACESSSFSDRDILVGFDFLRHFNYIFDYPHGRLVMIPQKE